jgi:hypothetical protein
MRKACQELKVRISFEDQSLLGLNAIPTVNIHRRCGGAICFHFQGLSSPRTFRAMTMEAVGSTETKVTLPNLVGTIHFHQTILQKA